MLLALLVVTMLPCSLRSVQGSEEGSAVEGKATPSWIGLLSRSGLHVGRCRDGLQGARHELTTAVTPFRCYVKGDQQDGIKSSSLATQTRSLSQALQEAAPRGALRGAGLALIATRAPIEQGEESVEPLALACAPRTCLKGGWMKRGDACFSTIYAEVRGRAHRS